MKVPLLDDSVASLDLIADADGHFSIIAMDQRNTLRRMFRAAGLDAADEELRRAKREVARVLTPLASGMLLDPTIGVPAVQSHHALAPSCGLLVAAEPEVRGEINDEPVVRRDPCQNAAWVQELGGAALKFLVQIRGDRPSPLLDQALGEIDGVVKDCAQTGIPSVIENLIYALPGEQLTHRQREDAIVESARVLNELDIDLLKLEYPGSAAGCRRLASVLSRPWAVLSAGVEFGEFANVLEVSTDEGGASGFIAGRSLWKEAVVETGAKRLDVLEQLAKPRLARLLEVNARAVPWRTAKR